MDAYVLGMFDFATYQARPLHLHKGDVLIVYSDGLTDAQGELEEAFGEERLTRPYMVRSDGSVETK